MACGDTLKDTLQYLAIAWTPLSLSMPLSVAEHGDKAVRPFLWGLLPRRVMTPARSGASVTA